MSRSSQDDHALLAAIAHRVMMERGMEPDFPSAARRETAAIGGPAAPVAGARDLRDLLWASIDNDDSRDLDQITVAEALAGGRVRILVAIADVDALVRKGSAVDDHASPQHDLRLHPRRDLPDAARKSSPRASPRSTRTRTAWRWWRTWFSTRRVPSPTPISTARSCGTARSSPTAASGRGSTGEGPAPRRLSEVPGLDANLRLQDGVARKARRPAPRAAARLSLESLEPKAVFDGDSLADLVLDRKNRAQQIIEDFMIAANGVTAAFSGRQGFALAAPRRFAPPNGGAASWSSRRASVSTSPASRTPWRSRGSSRSVAGANRRRSPTSRWRWSS